MLEKSCTFAEATWCCTILLQWTSYLKYFDETWHFCDTNAQKYSYCQHKTLHKSRSLSLFTFRVFGVTTNSTSTMMMHIYAWKCSFSALNNLHKIRCSREIHHYPRSWRNFRTRSKSVAHSLAQLPIEPEIEQLYHIVDFGSGVESQSVQAYPAVVILIWLVLMVEVRADFEVFVPVSPNGPFSEPIGSWAYRLATDVDLHLKFIVDTYYGGIRLLQSFHFVVAPRKLQI